MLTCFALSQAHSATINLAWDAIPATSNVTKYTLYEKGSTGSYTKLLEITAPATTAAVPNVAPGTHTYVVSATNVFGESGKSNEATITLAAPPSNLKFISITF